MYLSAFTFGMLLRQPNVLSLSLFVGILHALRTSPNNIAPSHFMYPPSLYVPTVSICTRLYMSLYVPAVSICTRRLYMYPSLYVPAVSICTRLYILKVSLCYKNNKQCAF